MVPHSGPMLKPKQRKDGTWYAEASWPNAPTEDIGHFKVGIRCPRLDR